MGRKGGNKGLPSWYLNKGKKVLDLHDGFELYSLDPNTYMQYGGYVGKKMYDSLTEQQRQDMIKRRTG